MFSLGAFGLVWRHNAEPQATTTISRQSCYLADTFWIERIGEHIEAGVDRRDEMGMNVGHSSARARPKVTVHHVTPFNGLRRMRGPTLSSIRHLDLHFYTPLMIISDVVNLTAKSNLWYGSHRNRYNLLWLWDGLQNPNCSTQRIRLLWEVSEFHEKILPLWRLPLKVIGANQEDNGIRTLPLWFDGPYYICLSAS